MSAAKKRGGGNGRGGRGGKAKPAGRKVATVQEVNEEFYECPVCKAVVYDDDKALECDTCCRWFHCSCDLVSDTTYNALDEEVENGLAWYCSGCRCGVKKLSDMFKVMINRQVKTEEDVKTIQRRQDVMHSNVQELEIKVNLLEKNAATASEIIREMKERERRQSSMMIFNVPESEDATSDRRVIHDTVELNKFMTNSLNISEADIPSTKQIIRVGSKNGGKPRPMKVTFNQKDSPKTVMQTWNKLDVSVKKTSKVQIALDLTPMQREEGKILRALRNKKQAELTKNGITNFKYVILGDSVRKIRIQTETQEPTSTQEQEEA